MQQLISKISNFISFDSIPVMGLADYVEILIIAFLVYEVMLWIKDTRAWSLMRGIVIILVFVLLAYLFQMTTILWLVRNGLNVLSWGDTCAVAAETRAEELVKSYSHTRPDGRPWSTACDNPNSNMESIEGENLVVGNSAVSPETTVAAKTSLEFPIGFLNRIFS